MKALIKIHLESIKAFLKNPILIIPPVILYLVIILLSKLSVAINYKLQTTPLLVSWLIFYVSILFFCMSFIFASLIGSSKKALTKKIKIKELFENSKKFWLKSLATLILFLGLYLGLLLILFAFTKSLILLSPYYTTTENGFRILSVSIYTIWILSIVIFFTFVNFYSIIYNLTIKRAVIKSIKFVRKNYLSTLFTLTIFSILYLLSQNLPDIFSNIISYLFITPLLSLVLTNILISKENDLRTS